MATGLAAATANAFLDALCNNTSYAIANVWIKMHVGDPGAAGASNAAAETTRKEATFSAAASGAIANDNALSWTNVAATEDWSHYSAWTASTNGTFLFSGAITVNAVTAGDNASIAAGDIDLSFAIAS